MPIDTEKALGLLLAKENWLIRDIQVLDQEFRQEIKASTDNRHRTDPTDMASTGHANSSARHSQIGQLKRALNKVRRIIQGIENGTLDYGICEKCGEEIPDGRLELYPETTLCVPCKSGEERIKKRLFASQNGRLAAAIF
jgi:DnaK suppressor protein